MQFRAVDAAGFTSSWAPSLPTAGSTVRIDRTLPTAPTVAGGSTTWQNVASVTVTATGRHGHRRIRFRRLPAPHISTDGGATWSTASARQQPADRPARARRWCSSATTDNAGNASAWTPADDWRDQHGADRPHGAERPGHVRRADRSAWQTCRIGRRDGVRRHGLARQRRRLLPVPDVPRRRQHLGRSRTGATATISTQGETLVQFRAVDGAGFQSGWAPAAPTPETHRPARPHRPHAADADRRLTELAERCLGERVRQRHRRTPTRGWPATSTAPRRTTGRAGATRSRARLAVITAEGTTLVQFRSQ